MRLHEYSIAFFCLLLHMYSSLLRRCIYNHIIVVLLFLFVVLLLLFVVLFM